MEIEPLYSFLDRKIDVPDVVGKLSKKYQGWIWGENASILAHTSDELKDYWNVIIPSDKLWNSLKADKYFSSKKIEFYGSERFCIDDTKNVVDVVRTDLSWFLNQEGFREKERFAVNMNYNAFASVHNFGSKERNLPEKVRELSEKYEGWIWGPGGLYLAKPDFPMPEHNWNIIIPSDELWEKVSSLVPENSSRKSDKHFSFYTGNPEFKIDIMRTDPLWFFTQGGFDGRPQVLVNLNYGSVMNYLSLGHLPEKSYSKKS